MTLFSAVTEVSFINWIDGSENCEEGSALGYAGIIVWILLSIYIFMGLYILCEDFFVPPLTILGEKWGLSEDVCGATLMAVGSSSPELFTALIGAFLYPDENPGPSTNCASAVFNMCVIIGLSILYSGWPNYNYSDTSKNININKNPNKQYEQKFLLLFPFIRDCTFYAFSLLIVYISYDVSSVGEMELWEAFVLVFIWVLYIVVLVKDEQITSLVERIFKIKVSTGGGAGAPLKQPLLSTVGSGSGGKNSGGNINSGTGDGIAKGTAGAGSYRDSLIVRPSRTSNLYLRESEMSGHGSNDTTNNNNDSDIFEKHDTIELVEVTSIHKKTKYPEFTNPTWKERLELAFEYSIWPFKFIFEKSNCGLDFHSDELAHAHAHGSGGDNKNTSMNKKKSILGGAPHSPLSDLGVGKPLVPIDTARSVSNFMGYGDGNLRDAIDDHDNYNNNDNDHVEDNSDVLEITTGRLMISFGVSIFWLGILTFLIVDLSNKIGSCLSISTDVMGLTLLAIGSSLPDAFSSVLVARQGKLSMAVSTALGSNIFDICVCVGVPFLIKSFYSKVEIESSEAFELFLIGVFVTLGLFIVMFAPIKLKVFKGHGIALLIMYFTFITTYIIVFQTSE